MHKAKKTVRRQFLTVKAVDGSYIRCGWPSALAKKESTNHILVRLVEPTPENLGRLDPWALACYSAHVSKHPGICPVLGVDVRGDADQSHVESLRRRLSYLNLVNDFDIGLQVNGKTVSLYSHADMVQFGASQVICDRSDFDEGILQPAEPISGEDSLMFDPHDVIDQLKTYLKGQSFGRCPAKCASNQSLMKIDTFTRKHLKNSRNKGLESRLDIFGDEFKTNRNYHVVRRLPVGAFMDYVSEKNRVLPNDTLDLMAVNRGGELGVITFNLGDVELDVLARSLNNALYVSTYWSQLVDNPELVDIVNSIEKNTAKHYVSGGRFHPLFDHVAAYYRPQHPFDFEFRKIRVSSVEPI